MSRIGKYAAVAALAFRQRLAERAALYGRMMFYVVVLLTFSRLWEAVLGTHPSSEGGEPSVASYVWYLVVTEWIVLSQPTIWQEIEADVRSGDVAYQLSRPMSYAGTRLAEAVGELSLRWIVLGAQGLIFGRLFSGEWPSAAGLALTVPVAALASVVLLLVHLGIGLSAFWLHDCTSVYLIWQKLMFVIGGLMVPPSILPGFAPSRTTRHSRRCYRGPAGS
jgi:ABC-2 type transport system permease protein